MTSRKDSAVSAREDGELGEKQAASRIDELKLWLRGLINKPDFFTTRPLHDIDDLHRAVHLAAIEIVQRLDPELECVINMAGESDFNILLDEDEFYATRKIDVEEIRDMGLDRVRMFTRDRTVILLELARDEIEWIQNETKRLELHCRNAKDLRQAKLRSSFEYRPTPRIARSRIGNFRAFQAGNVTPVARRVPEEVVPMEDDDEEMLDIAEVEERRRRSPPPSP